MRASFPLVYGSFPVRRSRTIKILMVIGAWRPLELDDIPERIRAGIRVRGLCVSRPCWTRRPAGPARVLTDVTRRWRTVADVVRGNDEDRFQEY
jgi:hypothetical protein